MIDIDGQAVLEMQAPGLLPFAPLMKRPVGVSIEQWVQECINAVAAMPFDEQAQGDLFCALSLFGGIIYDPLLFKRMIQEERMQESKYYRLLRDEFITLGREQGLEQGARESTIKNILKFLNNRFPAESVNDLIPKLQRISDLERLEGLLFAAPQVNSLDAFKLMLEE